MILGYVACGMCDFIKVMYQGRVVEEGTTEEIFYHLTSLYEALTARGRPLRDKEENSCL